MAINLSNTSTIITDCGNPVVKLSGYSSCYDNVTGIAFGGELGFRLKTQIPAIIKKLPRNIERTISLNCTVERVDVADTYEIQGLELFPSWKAKEIEDLFSLETILINGNKVVFRGGTIFQKANFTCPDMFKLSVIVEFCPQKQIYACGEKCFTGFPFPNNNDFLIPKEATNKAYFNESGSKIAYDIPSLRLYLQNQTGVKEAVQIFPSIDCEYLAVLRVSGYSILPTLLYYDRVSLSTRITGIDTNGNDNALCNGIAISQCGTLVLGTPIIEFMICGILSLGTPIIIDVGSNCNIIPMNGWQDTGGTSIHVNGDSVSVDLYLKNNNYSQVLAPVADIVTYTVSQAIACAIGFYPDIIISYVKVNGISISAYTYNSVTGALTFNPCLNVGDAVEVEYIGNVLQSPTFTGEVIANISGIYCPPKVDRIISDNIYLPYESFIVVKTNGDILYYGRATAFDNSSVDIVIPNLIYLK